MYNEINQSKRLNLIRYIEVGICAGLFMVVIGSMPFTCSKL